MDKNIAKLLLENLLARVVVDPDTGQGTLAGVLTPMEIEALKMASISLLEPSLSDGEKDVCVQPSAEPEIDEEPDSGDSDHIEDEAKPALDAEPEAIPEPKPVVDEKTEVEPPPPAKLKPEIQLNLASLKFNAPQNNDTKMCLDFGTAMSKAFASVVEDDEVVDSLLLKLGYRASGGKSKDIYPVPSSLWISNDGTISLGEKAIALSLQSDPSGNRERFDSLKKELILGLKESSPFEQPIRATLNPTDTPLSMGDAIILYLGYLTDLACTELEESHNCSRYVLRNFGLPSWAPERRTWGEDLLKKMLIKAQIVADTFQGKWAAGLDIHDVKLVLEKIEQLDKLPDYLVLQGITEPLAVASSRLQGEEPFRGLTMVVDVGAGTSDLALFVVRRSPDQNLFNAFPVLGCNQSLHQAGDTLDTAMQQLILKKSGVGNHDPDYPYIIQHLRLQVRALKEDLFRDGDCTVNLVNGSRVTVSMDDFLGHATVKRFRESLADKFNEVLISMKKGVAKLYGRDGLSVVLTGGGATLPMVKELAQGSLSVHGILIGKDEVPLVPEEYEDDAEISLVYPQLAVAIGGTMPVIIDEKTGIDDMDIPQGEFSLGRNPISGN